MNLCSSTEHGQDTSTTADIKNNLVLENMLVFVDEIAVSVGTAKAGAKKVIAVDNSNIIDRAKEIVHDNGLGDVIT
jgi:protein arginine N-methyltransferase 3